MTNLSTSEDREFKRLKEIVTEKWDRSIIFDSNARADVRALFDTHAQTLLKLERAKEALRFYSDPPNFDKEGERLSVPDFYDEMDFGETARATLAYIKEGKE